MPLTLTIYILRRRTEDPLEETVAIAAKVKGKKFLLNKKKTCIWTINHGPENMRDNNVTFNTLLKDNKNQVKQDSLQFMQTTCTKKKGKKLEHP